MRTLSKKSIQRIGRTREMMVGNMLRLLFHIDCIRIRVTRNNSFINRNLFIRDVCPPSYHFNRLCCSLVHNIIVIRRILYSLLEIPCWFLGHRTSLWHWRLSASMVRVAIHRYPKEFLQWWHHITEETTHITRHNVIVDCRWLRKVSIAPIDMLLHRSA